MKVKIKNKDYSINDAWAGSADIGILTYQLGDKVDMITQKGFLYHYFISEVGRNLCVQTRTH